MDIDFDTITKEKLDKLYDSLPDELPAVPESEKPKDIREEIIDDIHQSMDYGVPRIGNFDLYKNKYYDHDIGLEDYNLIYQLHRPNCDRCRNNSNGDAPMHTSLYKEIIPRHNHYYTFNDIVNYASQARKNGQTQV